MILLRCLCFFLSQCKFSELLGCLSPQHVRFWSSFGIWFQAWRFLNFVGVSVKGVRCHSYCGSKSHHMRSLSCLAYVPICEVSDVCVGLSHRPEVFDLFQGVFPESEVSEVFS